MTGISDILRWIEDVYGGVLVYSGRRDDCLCEKKFTGGLEEGLVVDTLAYYDRENKEIIICECNLSESIRYFRIRGDAIKTYILYVLTHEFCHHLLDVAKLSIDRSGVLKIDEPFCEFLALNAIATGSIHFLNFVLKLNIDTESHKRFLPYISMLPRPPPYKYFRELFARAYALGLRIDRIYLCLLSKVAKLPVESPDPNILVRLLYITTLSGEHNFIKMENLPTLRNVGVARVWICGCSKKTTF